MALPQRYVEKDFYTKAEYLAWERDVPYKSEYVNGQIIPLNGEGRTTSSAGMGDERQADSKVRAGTHRES